MQLASVSVVGSGIGKMGNDPVFVNEVLKAFRDQYDRERNSFVKSNGRECAKLDTILEEKYGTLSKYPEIREAQLKSYRGFMSSDLKSIVPWGMLPNNL